MSDAQEEKAPQDATDPELLNKIHAALIMILRELDAACEQLGISYVVCGGTAIGAARHKGFIPWDDDVDVYMPRGDYERFLAEAPAILPPEFEVLSSRSHPDYPKTFGILGLVGSTFTVGEHKLDRRGRVAIDPEKHAVHMVLGSFVSLFNNGLSIAGAACDEFTTLRFAARKRLTGDTSVAAIYFDVERRVGDVQPIFRHIGRRHFDGHELRYPKSISQFSGREQRVFRLRQIDAQYAARLWRGCRAGCTACQ